MNKVVQVCDTFGFFSNDKLCKELAAINPSIEEIDDAIVELKKSGFEKLVGILNRFKLNFPGQLKIGDGATVHWYSDSHAGTIVEISKSGKTIVIQEDEAVLDPNFKPEMHIGGFCAHCSNQNEQSYIYSPDTKGSKWTAKLSINGRWYVGGRKGYSVTVGDRRKFHDYNF